MTVSPASIVARAATGTAPTVVPIGPQRRKRLQLYDRIVEMGCDAIATANAAQPIVAHIGSADRRCDWHVGQIDQIAHHVAMRADALGDDELLALAARIRQHCAGYRQADAIEDAGVGTLGKLVGRVAALVRACNERLTAELSKRGYR